MVVDPISEDDVFNRLHDRLIQQGLVLRRGTLDGMRDDARGRFYTTRGASEEIVDRHVDLERWAREQGVLKPNEAFVPTPDPAG